MLKNYFILILSFILLSCSEKDSIEVGSRVDQDFVNAYDAFEMSKNPKGGVTNSDTVSMSEGVWLGNKSVVLEHKNNLPSKYETESGITIVLNEVVNLQNLANHINNITGIPVKIDNQVDSDKLKKSMKISYTGKLSRLLSQISTDLDLLWYYDKNTIVFYETETKTYSLYALGTDVAYNSSISTDSGNKVVLESNLKEWDEIQKSIESILSKSSNSSFTVSKSLGTITVTASPSVQSRVAEYIEKQNKRLSQLVAIDVKVLQVSIANSSNFGLNLGAAINSASGLQIVASPYNSLGTSQSNQMNIAVLNGTQSSTLSGLKGSNALIEALAKQGKVSLVTNVGVTTRNNRIAPISNTKKMGYIKRFESRNFATSESSTVDQDDLETGFSMQLLPNVLDNGKILLLFKMSIKELLSMKSEKIGAVALQLPEVEERTFMQEVIMESGQMLVVSGFEKQQNNDTKYGIGKPDFMTLSGSRETESQRDVLVVMLTPQVLVSPMDAEKNIQQNWGAPLN